MKKKVEVVEEPAVLYEAEISSFDQLDLSKLYSYADYFRWKLTERVELIRGMIHKMSPAPGTLHQSVSMKLSLRIGKFFENKRCKVFAAPFDVRLPEPGGPPEDRLVRTVVQPDLSVICDPSRIDSRGCVGAPDLVVEIWSPGNSRRERDEKFELYEQSGVKEYWLADPESGVIQLYTLHGRRYRGLQSFFGEDVVRSPLFPGLKFVVKEVFEG